MPHKQFHIGDVMTVVHQKFLSPSGWDGLYAILRYLTGEPVYTHQVNRVLDECQVVMRQRYPQFVMVSVAGVNDETSHRKWLAEVIAEHGEFVDVSPLPPNTVESIDPLSELAARMHPDRIVQVSLPT